MSVPKAKRDESKVEFLYQARQLQLYTIRKCVGFPKRYTFYVGQPIANCATRIHEDVKRGNSIYPVNAHEAEQRISYFIDARAELYNLTSLVEVAAELFGIEEKALRHWMSLVNTELNLVTAVIKADRVRYKNLPLL